MTFALRDGRASPASTTAASDQDRARRDFAASCPVCRSRHPSTHAGHAIATGPAPAIAGFSACRSG
jgi:hypothetical protein